MTCDTRHVSSSALTVWDRQCLEDSELKDHLMNQLMNHEGVYRTAPATPGLLTILFSIWIFLIPIVLHIWYLVTYEN